MDDVQLDDLKQFITTTVGQSETRIRQDLGQQIDELRNGQDSLRQEMHDGFVNIADIVDRHNDQLENHETRLTKLEQQ